jgi:hypothetical protein
MDQEITLDQVMSRHFELTDEMAIIAARHKTELGPLAEELNLVDSYIKAEMTKAGMQQCKTAVGQAFFTTKDSVTVRDWDAVVAYIKGNDAWHLLNHAVAKNACKEFIETNNAPPPGVEYSSYKDLSWRRGK